MRHLVKSFQENLGVRGCHFYDNTSCNFLDWREVLEFTKAAPDIGKEQGFTEKLLDTLSNYDPDTQFLAVQHSEGTVSVELYVDPSLEGIKAHG
jgi:hypothetical protein